MTNSIDIARDDISITPALENYLETIAALKREKKYARVRDIAKALEVKSPTANVAINSLCGLGLVIHERYGYVDLTDKGEMIAREVQNKHDILFNFLTELLFVNKDIAIKEACAIEHSISSETVEKLQRMHNLLKKYFLTKEEDVKKLKDYIEENKN
jgi:DtxR family Mn-dependent transcriptional regulator